MNRTRAVTVAVSAIFAFILLSVFLNNRLFAESQGYIENPVLAEINGEQITLNDLKEAAKGASGRGYAGLSLEDKKKLLNNLILYKLLYIEAKNRKLDEVPEVKKALEDAKGSIMAHHLSDMEISSKIQVSDDEVKEYYEKNKETFMPPQEATITFFNLLKQNSSGENKPEEAKNIANIIKERLLKGESFENIFSSHKEDREWGNSLSQPSQTTVPKGKYYKGSKFDDLVFSTHKEGFGIVEFADRFFIFRVDDKKTSEPPLLKDIEPAISGNLKQKKYEVLLNDFLENLKKRIPTKTNEELIK